MICGLSQAASRADLTTTIIGPTELEFAETGTYSVITNNAGARNARRTELVISLPADFSIVTASSSCMSSPGELTCDLRRIRGGQSKTVSLQLAAPNAVVTGALAADATTRSREDNDGNNSDVLNISVVDPTPPPPPTAPVAAPQDLKLDMCVSLSGSISWSDCTPGSLLTQTVTLQPDLSIVTNDPGVYGDWNQSVSATDLTLDFFNQLTNDPMSTMTGVAVSGTCFEGTTVFHQGLGQGAWRGCLQ